MSEDIEVLISRNTADVARENRQRMNDYRAVLSTEEGRRVFGELVFNVCGLLVMTGGPVDDFRQGMRHVGVCMLDTMTEADPAATVAIVQETHIDEYRRSHRIDD